MSEVINVDGLGRYFGEIKAVDSISFTVSKGDVLGFLGPNGAGKSTTMKMLTCFLSPSFGTASVAGFDVQTQSREVRQAVGYLPENAPLYSEMKVGDFLDFVANIKLPENNNLKAEVLRVAELTTLQSVLKQRIGTLSKGFRRRVGLAQALIGDPEILILDEPTDGLDPNQKHEVRNLIRSIASQKCIILSTHILEEVEEVCNRAIIIAHGKIVADATPAELRKQSSGFGSVRLTAASSLVGEIQNKLKAINGIGKIETDAHHSDLSTLKVYPKDGASIFAPVLSLVENQHWDLYELHLDHGQLDDVFRRVTQ